MNVRNKSLVAIILIVWRLRLRIRIRKVKSVFDQWKNEDFAALESNLSKNQELKYALLEETPWVFAAQDEAKRKKEIALLFDLNKMEKELKFCF